jgi:hypothetical protein
MASLYPAFTEEFVRRGATKVSLGCDVVWYLPDGKAYNPTGSIRTPFDSGLVGYCASRGLIEFVIRRQTSEIGQHPSLERNVVARTNLGAGPGAGHTN